MRTLHRGRLHVAVVFAVMATGCGSSDTSGQPSPSIPASTDATLVGEVRLGTDTTASPASGIDVAIYGDFNGDGQSGADEVVHATTDASGMYRATVKLAKATRLRFTWSGADVLPNHNARTVSPGAAVRVDALVTTGEALVDQEGKLALPDGRLELEGLPAGTTGVGRLYNPTIDQLAFPGDFVDDTGTRIRSAAFATLEMKDADGKDVKTLAAPATLSMQISPDTWRVVADMTKGTDRIDVPKYYYDETKGAWVQEGLGYLVDGAGQTLPENALVAIHDGSYQGTVTAVYSVSHFSTYNVDFPAAGSTQASGKGGVPKSYWQGFQDWAGGLLRGSGQSTPAPTPPNGKQPPRKLQDFPEKGSSTQSLLDFANSDLVAMTGAQVLAEFYYADGTFAGHTGYDLGADGAFTLEMPQSEGPDEDLDDNGIKGETFYLDSWVESYGVRFQLVSGEIPTGAGHHFDLGELDLSGTMVSPAACTVHGVVTYRDGSLASDADVWFTPDRDPTVEDFESLCGADGSKCSAATKTGADGTFSITYPFEMSFALGAGQSVADGPWIEEFYGQRTDFACPATPVTVVLTWANASVAPTLLVTGQEVSWEPAVPVSAFVVSDKDGNTKWELSQDTAPFSPPITYGVVAQGSNENGPPVGTLQSGDSIWIYGTTTDSKGYDARIEQQIVVP